LHRLTDNALRLENLEKITFPFIFHSNRKNDFFKNVSIVSMQCLIILCNVPCFIPEISLCVYAQRLRGPTEIAIVKSSEG